MSSSAPIASPLRRPWLFGAAADLMLGCGLGWLALVSILALARLDMADMARIEGWLPLVVLVTGIPHYGATLLRVFARAEARRRYAWWAFGAGALVWGAFLAGARVAWVGAWLITLYLSWSPWHYAAQNFGLALMFLHRRGVRVGSRERGALQASFVLSFAAVLAAWNMSDWQGVGGRDPLYAAGAGWRFIPLGIPTEIGRPLVAVLAALGVAAAAYALVRLARQVRSDTQSPSVSVSTVLGPTIALVLAQMAWFTLPALAGVLAPERWAAIGAATAFIWVAIGHSVQYLWVSLHFARGAGDASPTGLGGLAWFGKTVLAGAAMWVVPALLLAPGALGRLPFEAGLGLLVAAAVNLHHFLLDGAIWKLRDAKVSQVLVADAAKDSGTHRSRWSGTASIALTVGAAAVACWIVAAWENEIGVRRARAAGDLDRMIHAARRLAAVGRDGPRLHLSIGRLAAARGRPDEALVELHRSLALGPSPSAWIGIGRLREAGGDLRGAADAYQAAITVDPASAAAHDHAALAWLRLGDPGRALGEIEYALALSPNRPAYLRHRAAILKAAGEGAPSPSTASGGAGSDRDGE